MGPLSLGRVPLPLCVSEGEITLYLPARAPFAPLSLLLSWAQRGAFGDFRAKVERGEDLGAQEISLTRPEPERRALAERRWQAWTGLPPSDDLYLVQAGYIEHPVSITRAALLSLHDQLDALNRAYRAGGPGPMPDPDLPAPPEPDRFQLHLAEGIARDLDTLDAEITPDNAGAAAAKRRVLLVDLERLGLLDEALRARNDAAVEALWFPTLRGYLEAAFAIFDYLKSPERRAAMPSAPPFLIVGGPVSLDWFRLGPPIPPRSSPHLFLAFCEDTLTLENLVSPFPLGQGDFLCIAEHRYRIAWRKDDGVHPALLSATWAE
ncbi:hypothetical protein [Sorangium sp. So ce388]|uniref:hypothetical protein n=1 Tax=Sorangium sp. So ce388 TaxID=3133309 RepID=UPI003F5B9852